MVQGSAAMKFYCEQCNTKYSIAEEKVRGKVLKVRCKNCGNIITVRDPEAPIAATDPAPTKPAPPKTPASAATPKVPQKNWYFSVNGQSSAAMDLSALKAKYASGELGDESYVWHESLVQWKPVRDVDIFAEALARSQAVRPRAKTIGFTGALEAIKVEDAPRGPQAGAAPVTAKPAPTTQTKTNSLREALQKTPAPTPTRPSLPANPVDTRSSASQPAKPIAETPSAKEMPRVEPASVGALDAKKSNAGVEPRGDRLEKLREKLRNDAPPVALDSFKSSKESPSLADSSSDAFPFDTEKVPAQTNGAGVSLPAFDLKPLSPSTSNIFEALPDEEESSEDSGLIAFFNDAPKFESSMGTAKAGDDGVSASLLIRIDEMKGQDRKQKRLVMGAGVVFLVVAVVAGAVHLASDNKETLMKPAEPVAQKTQERRPVEKTYSSDKLNAFAMELGEEVIPTDEPVTAEEPAPAEAAAVVAPSAEPQPSKVVGPSAKEPAVAASKGTKTEPKKEAKAPANSESVATAEPVSARDALLNYQASSVRRDPVAEIKRPEDQLATTTARPKTLSKDEARKGFKNIRQSITVCRERHMRRGTPFAAKKIKVTITVEPSGTVSGFTLEPKEIRLTEFDVCMQSHMERWKFAAWDGMATEINSSFVIQ